MTALVTYKAPAMEKGKIVYVEKAGKIAWFNVGAYRVKFALQENGALVHYASGNIVVSANAINALKLSRAVQSGFALKTTDRMAAEMCLQDAVAKHGAQKVFDIMSAAPVIN